MHVTPQEGTPSDLIQDGSLQSVRPDLSICSHTNRQYEAHYTQGIAGKGERRGQLVQGGEWVTEDVGRKYSNAKHAHLVGDQHKYEPEAKKLLMG